MLHFVFTAPSGHAARPALRTQSSRSLCMCAQAQGASSSATGGATSPDGSAARADAVTAGTASALSPRIMELIKQQIAQPIYNTEACGAFAEQAEKEKRFLSLSELAQVRNKNPPGNAEMAAFLEERVDAIVQAARERMLETFPGIDQPGGGLFPAFRAKACWRDFVEFVRVVTYSVALGLEDDFLDPVGLSIMEKLYEEFEVPLDAMVFGVCSLRDVSAEMAKERGFDETEWDLWVKPAFGRLIIALESYIK
ncbi:Allophycocyanin alpha chain [Porphyridium purpureum]|uniref:Allophycocyanin alpha chain n=1 Tax=Porphyridium purpureum TaxID=35688 RepID=A0A5J4YUJ7_PORPP|nr:Allophycocyanin alpha chain [Porphyridium purpureum]|eukprot:POR9443..scf227_4